MKVRRVHLYFTLLLLGLCLNACTSITDLKRDVSERVFGKENANPPAELNEFKASVQLQQLWSSRLGKTERYDFTPVFYDGFIYATSAENQLIKLDAKGVMQWKRQTDEPISGGVGVGSNILMVGTVNGSVLAYDFSGKLLWKSSLSSEILSAPRFFDDIVIVRCGDNHIYGINALDGSRKWVYERAVPTLSLRSSAGVVVDGGAVYAGFAGGKLIAIRADNGKMLWETSVAQPKGVTEIERIADITSLPVVDGPIVYAVAYQGKIAAVDRRTGKVVWNRDISSYSGLSMDGARVLVSHAIGSVYSLDYENGKTYWRQGDLTNRDLSTPLALGSYVAVGDIEGYVHLLSREDGAFAGRIKLDSNPIMPQMVDMGGNQFLAQTRNGGLFVVSIK